ncbi:hypothetical protein B5C34_04555 [Pacificimonas flava]|uniref:Peptidase M48 domain-containing protein n=2 Tax=Pacificimonas TaxID=1960290 RepID=A0A219B3N1_9SPHN|nr:MULTISPECIES: M48 family metallopeptidase [Pacificimonas]MBZ6377511.1 M48 family metallopeptidase [Pacificimonas aurantium]OWV32794.1 hypothetical protein B5C34_04555 [Pacificimonas flava]
MAPAPAAEGWLYDGLTARRWPVRVEADSERPDSLLIIRPEHPPEQVAAVDLRQTDRRDDAVLLGRRDSDGWQLGLRRPVPPEVAARLPAAEIYGAWIDRLGLPQFAAAGVFVTMMVLALLWFAPTWLAPLVPQAWERQFGATWLGQMEADLGCWTGPGRQALAKIERRLSPEQPYLITVVDVPIENAAALPGGDIVLFRPVVENAGSPEELAGIVAHEMAHVKKRHVTEALIRHFGFGLLLSSVGGNAGTAVTQMTGLTHTRAAEREADRAAIATMLAADVSPAEAADFFRRVGGAERDEGGDGDEPQNPVRTTASRFPEFLRTHPAPDGRVARFTRAAEGRAFRPLLNDEEWAALQSICRAPIEGAPDDPR